MIDSLTDAVIAAPATPEGPGSLTLLRVSGPGSWRVVGGLLAAAAPSGPPFRAQVPVLGELTWVAGEPPTPALVIPYATGASYTGEESVEIAVPGCPPLVRGLLATLRERGVRAALPGEFTRRAFLGGRMDLTAAESVAELIAAEDRQHARQARGALDGQVAERIREVGADLADLVALLEAGLDFSEQEVEPPSTEVLSEVLLSMEGKIAALLVGPALSPRESARVRVLLWGRSNAGKSTLFNRLAERPLAITSDREGTTRDPLTARIQWPGLPDLELVDLPGTRESTDPVEREALELGRSLIEGPDRVLYLMDVSSTSPEAVEREWGALPHSVRERAWPVLSKVDDRSAVPTSLLPEAVRCSAITEAGVEELVTRLGDYLRAGQWTSRGEAFLFTDRQRTGLAACAGLLRELRGQLAVETRVAPELLVIDLGRARAHLEEVTGELATEEILDRIFSRFCLGK